MAIRLRIGTFIFPVSWSLSQPRKLLAQTRTIAIMNGIFLVISLADNRTLERIWNNYSPRLTQSESSQDSSPTLQTWGLTGNRDDVKTFSGWVI